MISASYETMRLGIFREYEHKILKTFVHKKVKPYRNINHSLLLVFVLGKPRVFALRFLNLFVGKVAWYIQQAR